MERRTFLALASVFLAATLTLTAGAQAQDSPSAKVRGHWTDGRIVDYQISPDPRLVFPAGDVQLAKAEEPLKWQNPTNPFAKPVDFVKVSDTQNRFWLAGIIFGGQLFIFDEFFCGQNAETMTRLMLATGTAPASSADALRLVGVFVSLSDYRLDDPQKIMGSTRLDISKQIPHRPGFNAEKLLEVWHSPSVKQTPFGYDVDLFTMATGIASERWRMTIGSRGVTELAVRFGTATYEAFKHPETATPTFQLSLVGDGFAENGARTGLSSWIASDGPGVESIHYYYESRSGADELVQKLVNSAVTTVSLGAWLGADGKAAGKRSTIVIPVGDHTHLQAVDVREEDARAVALVLRCACLRNLLAAEK